VRQLNRWLMLVCLTLAAGLVGALLPAPALAASGDSPAVTTGIRVVDSHYSGGSLDDLTLLSVLLADGILDWDTLLYHLFGDAVESKPEGDRVSGGATVPDESDDVYQCDPHPDVPK
jgi:hypothetical protein